MTAQSSRCHLSNEQLTASLKTLATAVKNMVATTIFHRNVSTENITKDQLGYTYIRAKNSHDLAQILFQAIKVIHDI